MASLSVGCRTSSSTKAPSGRAPGQHSALIFGQERVLSASGGSKGGSAAELKDAGRSVLAEEAVH